jgi:hypothetical protein
MAAPDIINIDSSIRHGRPGISIAGR